MYFEVDVFEIVLPGAANSDEINSHWFYVHTPQTRISGGEETMILAER
jgi:hypothetical protein